jgi:hypothetical protein
MSDRLPLTALLSQALVAFTIEFDNEWESRLPSYSTTDFGGTGLWAVSLKQWADFMKYVPEDGISVRELTRIARVKPHLNGMTRWGYVKVDAQKVIRPTGKGRRAQGVWAGLSDEVERRWSSRLGESLVAGLREALEPAAARFRPRLPDWITHFYGGHIDGFAPAVELEAELGGDRRVPFYALLSIPLHTLALGYEHESGASLMYTANVLRLPGAAEGDGIPMAELPRLSGVASPALQSATGILVKRGFVSLGSGQGRQLSLTGKGAAEAQLYAELPFEVEQKWSRADQVRELLEAVLAQQAQLWPHIELPPECWRNRLPRSEVLPHHPMPRQGGHPDGV